MEGRERLCNGNEDVNVPAMQAVMKQATLPATKARKATRAKSDFLDGANVPIPAMAAPIDPGFENPHSAYVAIVAERFYDHKKKKKNYFINCSPNPQSSSTYRNAISPD